MRLGPLDVVGPGDTRPAKSVDDAKWSSFIGMLAYKAVRYGRTLVRIGRFTPASQTHHACGTVDFMVVAEHLNFARAAEELVLQRCLP
ncbi:hypothetical protein ACH3VS_39655 [Streptomyces sp. WSLK1-3]|uniref:zinc ribbon domain-containing protein n=1 Tax=Streptomyces sp. WSLK1-3 TaxID=3375475 RepID=UPI00378A20E5